MKSPFLLNWRGGEIFTVAISGVQLVFNFGKIIVLLKGHGAVIFLSTATGVLTLKKIPTTVISTTLRFIRKKVSNRSPVSHTDWGKAHIMDSLGECNYDFKYLVSILSDKEMPYNDRKQKAFIILKQQLNSGTMESLVSFLACVVSILVLFTILGDTTAS